MATDAASQKPSAREGGAYSLPDKAEALYSYFSKDRDLVEQKAREMAKLTIPSVYPPLGYLVGADISEENQSVGALCVNTLASKFQYLALPPARPFMRYKPVVSKMRKDIEAEPTLWSKVQIALGALAMEHRDRIEATSIRSAYVGLMKLLIVSGNGLWEHMDLDTPVYHKMSSYVVKRNNQGVPLMIILKRSLTFMDLDEDVKELIKRRTPDIMNKGREWEINVDIYAVQQRKKLEGTNEFYWEYWEEYDGELIPDTEFEADYETPPLYAAWMIPVYGQNWGRSYCEEYQGDLYKVEGLSAAENDGSAIASLMLMFLKPGARTSAKQIKEAQNLAVLPGMADDLSMFKTDKMQDMQFVGTSLETAIKRLGRAFLLISSVQRQGERVTAEEWAQLAKEINEATGGLYSENSQTVQRHIISRAVSLHYETDKDLPKLPKGIFKVAVVTGIEAMGQSDELAAMTRAAGVAAELFPEEFKLAVNGVDFIRRVFAGENVNQSGLVLSDEAILQKRDGLKKEAQQALLLQHASGPAVTAAAKMLPDGAAMPPGANAGAQGGAPLGQEQPQPAQ